MKDQASSQKTSIIERINILPTQVTNDKQHKRASNEREEEEI